MRYNESRSGKDIFSKEGSTLPGKAAGFPEDT